MFSFSLIADAPPASWQGAFYGGLGTALLAVVGYGLNRLTRLQESRDKKRDEQHEGNASVEIEHIRSFKDLLLQRQKDMHTLRGEMQAMQTRYEVRVVHLEAKVDAIKDAYHHLYSLALLMQQSWRTLRSRLKRLDTNFDENEFIDMRIEGLAPDVLFARVNAPQVAVNVFQDPVDPQKTTAVVTTRAAGGAGEETKPAR